MSIFNAAEVSRLLNGTFTDKVQSKPEISIASETLTATAGDFQVELAPSGEGHNGDYDPDDESDAELMRFTILRRDESGEFEAMDGTSWCTKIEHSPGLDTAQLSSWLSGVASGLDRIEPHRVESVAHILAGQARSTRLSNGALISLAA